MHVCVARIFAALAALGFVAPVTAEVEYAQIRSLAVDAVRDGDVAFARPWSKIVGKMLWVKDAGPADDPSGTNFDYWVDGGDPLKAVFLDQLAIELRRQHLFARPRNREIMAPYYEKMEAIVAAELSAVQQAGDDDEKQHQLDERLRELGDVLQTGIDACALDMGLAGAFVEPGQDDGSVWLDRMFAIYLPRQGPFTYGQVEQAVTSALSDRAIPLDMPRAVVAGRTLRVTDVGLPVEEMRPLAPIEEIVAELVKLQVRRGHSFQRQGNRAIMDVVYGQMQNVIRRQFDSLRQAGKASADARRRELAAADANATTSQPLARTALGRQLDSLLKQGLDRCARNMGNLRLENDSRGSANGIAAAGRVKLIAPSGTTIEAVYNTDHNLWELAGKPEDDYPWQSFAAGDAANLLGGYWFRLTMPSGERVSLHKKVDASDTELRFPAK
jgi:hypothetical protein